MKTSIFAFCLLVLCTCAGADQPIGSDAQKSRPGGLSPAESMARMRVAVDLQLDQLLAEPIVKQPVFVNFDERGRMWVVQYIQYPHPAGLKIISHDQYWRNVYDKVPLPPPNHVRGKDKITIHEDTNGDGVFDKHKTFVDGLNMATAVEHGRGGHWVLNPPYLLFYPDKDRDDVPDSDPMVHLAGFGLEDSHSIANSLRWGPDGWLYGAQGSTVTANIVRPGFDDKPVFSQGQNIWRYHPEQRRYEIFAEGGGNAFGVEIDSVGNVFSGHNGGDTRGFHYPQGGYLRKGFTKHGPLSNPYAFGFFEGMPHHNVERFTHNFVIYDGGSLPANYHGKLFGVEPMQGRVVVADFEPNGSSFQTADIDRPLKSDDDWFRPVDIKVGPDGGIYVCDWYDGQVNHYKNHEGNIDPNNGRIYRLQAKQLPRTRPFDLHEVSSDDLVDYLSHSNSWFRRTALRILADRQDRAVVPRLRALLASETEQLALEAFWALNLTSGIDDATNRIALSHPNPHVRVWAARLLGDARNRSFTSELVELGKTDDSILVRQQLAATARRLPAKWGLQILAELIKHDEDSDDVYQPLMIWWGIETQCRNSADDTIALFASNKSIWESKIGETTILPRLMQRFAVEGSRHDLQRCAVLLANAPNDATREILMKGFELAYAGRPLPSLPEELVAQIALAGGGSLPLRLRQHDSDAIKEALIKIADPKIEASNRLELIKVAGELSIKGLPEILLALLSDSHSSPALRSEAISALQSYPDDSVPAGILAVYSKLSVEEQQLSQALLSSRAKWAKAMVQAVSDDEIDPLSISIESLRNCLLFQDADLNDAIEERWGQIGGQTTTEMKAEAARLANLLNSRAGDVYSGQKLFRANCGKCHKLFIEGGDIGPDLTSYKRDDIPNMVLNVIHPNAEIREGFENYLVLTEDGRVITGLMVDRDNKVVVLRTAEGQTVTVDRDSIDESRVLGRSLMPDGLLTQLSDDEIADLFAYLRSTQPLNN